MELKSEYRYEDYDGEEETVSYSRKFLLLPGCCEKSRAALRPFMALREPAEDDGEPITLDKLTPEWTIPHLSWEYIDTFVEQELTENFVNIGYHKSKVPVEFCPYCGTKMPEIRLKKNPPEPVYSDADGGYRCGTCNERNRCCGCWPMEALFEVVEG